MRLVNMKHKRRLFERRKKTVENDQVALQITSMADIFTILLVFLLKGLASDTMVISPAHGTTLPSGYPLGIITEPALQVEVSKEGILLEKDFLVKSEDLQKSIQNGIIPALNEKLQRERDRQKIIAASNDSVKIDTRVILLSDETIPFSTMKVVLRTLAMQGYSDVKFAVVKNE